MDKILKLLEIAKKFGVKPSKVIGTQGNVVPYKKPSLVAVNVDEFKLKESIDSGAMTMDKVQQEMEETVRLALSKNLNDVELQRALNNAINIDRQFFPPVADVVKFGSGEEIKGKGLEQLIKKQGTKNPPTTVAGQLETQGKKLEKAGEDLKEITEPKSVIGDIIKDYGDFDKYMQSSEKTGYVRATVRQIMREDIQAGKLKLPKELQDQVMQGIGEPIDIYRKVYGEGALEQIDSLADDLGKFRTEEEAAKFARSKYTIEPKAKPVDESKTYEELEDILKKGPDEPEGKAQGGIIGYAMGGRIGFASGSDEDGILGKIKKDYDKSITKKIIDWNTDITEKTYDYLDKLGAPKPFQNAIESKKFEDEINLGKKILEMKKFKETNKKEKRTEEAEGGRIGFNKGKRVLDLIAEANKKLKGKKSMESVDPKTGEVTVPKEPIKTAEEPTGMTTMDPEPEIIDEKSISKNKSIMTIDDLQFKHKDAFNAHDQISVDIGDKIAPDMIAESMAEMKGKDYFNLSQKEQSNLYKKALAYVDDVRMTKKQNKSLYVRGDAITEENFGNTPFAPDLSGLEEARKMTKGMNLQEEMDMVLNQYDKSMFIKNEQGKVDVTNLQNVERMALLLKKDHPELYNRIFNLTDDLNQKEILSDFDVTGRKPNAKGGPAGGLDYLMGF